MKVTGPIVIFILIMSFAIADNTDKKSEAIRKPAIDFYQEEITLIVNDTISRVEGVYHIKNNTSKSLNLPLVFPFYVDSLTDFPHLIEIFYEDSLGVKRNAGYRGYPERKMIRLSVPVVADSSVTWHLNYEQRIKSKRAVYIITSTNVWSKPLDKATYTYIAPADFEIAEIWPEPDTSYGDSLITYRRCIKFDFLPSREMEINWK